MNLFSKPKIPAPTPPPTVDDAQVRVNEMRRGAQMRGRAASMLTQGGAAAPTAQRTVTGN